MFKRFFVFIIFSIFLFTSSVSKSDVNIVIKIDENIITNYDILNEATYLRILNPNLKELDNESILKLSKESLIREIIKKNEIEKVFDFSLDNPFVNDYLKSLYTKLNFDNESDFNDYILNSSDYSIDDVKEKLKIEIAWNELIFFKYKNQINIDKEKLRLKVNQLKNNMIKEYRLSEIVFIKRKNENLKDLVSLIKSNILEIGFNNTANIFSISDSAKFGGNIGWIDEKNLSGLLLENLKKISVGQHTDVIKIGNNFIIIKIEEIRETKAFIDKEEELEKMVKFETNKQLNQFSRIFFDKSKINYKIYEK
tara:strand:- start:2607 stop:3536 length:930 start_codon:yes stop_codon:yes gene_type:complete